MALYSGPHAIAVTLFEQVEAKVAEYEVISGQLAAADGDKEKALALYRETSEDKDAVKLRAVIEKATAQLHELAEKNVVIKTLSDEEKAKLTTEANLIKTNLADSIKAIEAVNKSMPLDPEGVALALKEFQANNPTRSKKGRPVGSSNSGSNSPRTYVNISVQGGSLTEARPFATFSALAQFFKAEVLDLQKAFANAAGVELDQVAGVDVPVAFEFKPHENGATYFVSTTPKERKKPGRKSEAEKAAAAKTDEKPAETPAEGSGE